IQILFFLLLKDLNVCSDDLNNLALWIFPLGSIFRERNRKEQLILRKDLYTENITDSNYVKNFFSQFPAAVEFYNNARMLTWMNTVAKNKWKASSNSLTGKLFIQKLQDLSDPVFSSSVERAYQGEIQIYKGNDFHKTTISKSSEEQKIEVFISPVYGKNLKVSGIAMVYLSPDLEHVTALLRESQQIQSRAFLSNFTHEFRTPLNWMLGFSDLIDREKDLNKIKEYNKNIQNGGKVLLTLVEKLIEMSSLMKDETELEVQEFSLSGILIETRNILNIEIRIVGNKINVRLNIFLNNNQDDILLRTDQRKLKQVLTYLIHNSLKFTTSGYIEIGCRELPENMILFYVKDSGIGISKDILHYIYEIFRKETAASPFLTNGHGLGLTLTRSYVNLMGGKIWVESESGKGARFFFTIKNHMNSENNAIAERKLSKNDCACNFIHKIKSYISDQIRTIKISYKFR
ncbi:MAG: sensor histidine kinase, partial [Bacteroidota bacterium]